jgi:nitronate monooxygenase
MRISRPSAASIEQLLGIELPVIQAPMAGVQDAALAAAISNAGGLGSLPAAMLNPAELEADLRRLTAMTDKPFNVNFFCHEAPLVSTQQQRDWQQNLAAYFDELGVDAPGANGTNLREPFGEAAMTVLEQFRPAVVSFHFGLPDSRQIDQIKRWGTRVLGCATTVDEARWLATREVDAVIAQGLEAGGHRGTFLTQNMTTQTGTLALVPRICAAVSIPVIAAGGIASPAGVTAALALGAAGVQIGTAFLLCSETKTSVLHRAALKSEASQHTAVTNVFTGRPARSMVNRLVRELGPIATSATAFPSAAGPVAILRAAAEARGSDDFTPLWCGQNATGCREIPAADLLRILVSSL